MPRSGTGPHHLSYGWVIVVIAMIGLMLTIGSTMHAYSLFVVPVSKDLALTRASMNTGLILVNAGAALAALVVGRLIDHYSARLIMAGSGAILAACLITLGLSHSLWLSAAVLSFPVGFAIAGVGTITAPALVARWFTAHRGRAMAITMMGISCGMVVVVPVIASAIANYGWRQSLIGIGSIIGVTLLLLALLVRNPSSDTARGAEDGMLQGQMRPEKRIREPVLTMPRFWGIALSTALATAAVQSMAVSLVPAASDAGIAATKAASLISAIGGAGIVGKLMVAWLGDRFDRALVLAGLYSLISVAGATLLLGHSYDVLLVASVFAGFSAGATIPLYLALLADEFGSHLFGTVNGNMTFISAVLGALAVRLSGEIFDRTGGYAVLFWVLVAAGLVSASLMLLSRNLWSVIERSPRQAA